MMGRKDSQMQLIVMDIESLIPKNHLLRKIEQLIDFGFIYEKLESYYSKIGRPSIDPVCMIKMLIIGYLYGIKSERRLEEEITLNIAYRWFCGFDMSDKIPNHSLFSQNRRRRFTDSRAFTEIFNHVVRECITLGIVTGEAVVSDGTFIPANVASYNTEKLEQEVEQSTVHYLDALDEELREQPSYREPTPVIKEKTIIKSTTDPDCGYSSQENKEGFGYLSEMTVDTDNGIVLGVDCYPANQRESNIILKHIDRIQTETGLDINKLGLDAGYDVGAVHRGLELLGIAGYVSCIDFSYDVLKRDLVYITESDCFRCPAGKALEYVKLTYKKSTQNYYRLYKMSKDDGIACKNCENRNQCPFSYGEKRVNVSSFYPAFYQNRQRYETAEYKGMKRLRGIWSEGTFAVLKREHGISRAKKRGLHRVHEECLFSALAINLKRMVKALSRPRVASSAAQLATTLMRKIHFFCISQLSLTA